MAQALSSSPLMSSGEAECSIFERALDALPDGVLLVDARRKIIYSNSAFARYWNIPGIPCGSRDDRKTLAMVTDQLVDPAGFVAEVERLHESLEPSEDELRFKDGRVFSRRSVPFCELDNTHARIWIFSDVTEARSATLDHLTGLRNRLAFSREFRPFVEDTGGEYIRSVAIMDVDNFKKYNDLYGHAAGDEVLRQIGTILRSHLHRADDLLFRIGGEEFVMAVRTDRDVDAHSLFDAVRTSITDLQQPHSGNPPYDQVTASLGIASFVGGRDANGVFRTVDEALYRAKSEGRNRIALARPS
ncbi:sensor domain-containing diguanylate cyclase [Novosphingobium sp. Gsoil 351]|uniref:sensor domain-containing diguanylate cyclase n=1 Tax=Novosphingobium sp. Gsoil 351 TaxID=2675225 RepID=UPI0012B4A179|nr:diguanylate cyclase [Novosphingobium sp. Gsoil 351]QGN56031.1 diguanylate cyclase [Novosphingobium sp. Gsoil 351]